VDEQVPVAEQLDACARRLPHKLPPRSDVLPPPRHLQPQHQTVSEGQTRAGILSEQGRACRLTLRLTMSNVIRRHPPLSSYVLWINAQNSSACPQNSAGKCYMTATSPTPEGPFEYHVCRIDEAGIRLVGCKMPVVCTLSFLLPLPSTSVNTQDFVWTQFTTGGGVGDFDLFVDDDGQAYALYKRAGTGGLTSRDLRFA
jgi:hypothetical protein